MSCSCRWISEWPSAAFIFDEDLAHELGIDFLNKEGTLLYLWLLDRYHGVLAGREIRGLKHITV